MPTVKLPTYFSRLVNNLNQNNNESRLWTVAWLLGIPAQQLAYTKPRDYDPLAYTFLNKPLGPISNQIIIDAILRYEYPTYVFGDNQVIPGYRRWMYSRLGHGISDTEMVEWHSRIYQDMNINTKGLPPHKRLLAIGPFENRMLGYE